MRVLLTVVWVAASLSLASPPRPPHPGPPAASPPRKVSRITRAGHEASLVEDFGENHHKKAAKIASVGSGVWSIILSARERAKKVNMALTEPPQDVAALPNATLQHNTTEGSANSSASPVITTYRPPRGVGPGRQTQLDHSVSTSISVNIPGGYSAAGGGGGGGSGGTRNVTGSCGRCGGGFVYEGERRQKPRGGSDRGNPIIFNGKFTPVRPQGKPGKQRPPVSNSGNSVIITGQAISSSDRDNSERKQSGSRDDSSITIQSQIIPISDPNRPEPKPPGSDRDNPTIFKGQITPLNPERRPGQPRPPLLNNGDSVIIKGQVFPVNDRNKPEKTPPGFDKDNPILFKGKVTPVSGQSQPGRRRPVVGSGGGGRGLFGERLTPSGFTIIGGRRYRKPTLPYVLPVLSFTSGGAKGAGGGDALVGLGHGGVEGAYEGKGGAEGGYEGKGGIRGEGEGKWQIIKGGRRVTGVAKVDWIDQTQPERPFIFTYGRPSTPPYWNKISGNNGTATVLHGSQCRCHGSHRREGNRTGLNRWIVGEEDRRLSRDRYRGEDYVLSYG